MTGTAGCSEESARPARRRRPRTCGEITDASASYPEPSGTLPREVAHFTPLSYPGSRARSLNFSAAISVDSDEPIIPLLCSSAAFDDSSRNCRSAVRNSPNRDWARSASRSIHTAFTTLRDRHRSCDHRRSLLRTRCSRQRLDIPAVTPFANETAKSECSASREEHLLAEIEYRTALRNTPQSQALTPASRPHYAPAPMIQADRFFRSNS